MFYTKNNDKMILFVNHDLKIFIILWWHSKSLWSVLVSSMITFDIFHFDSGRSSVCPLLVPSVWNKNKLQIRLGQASKAHYNHDSSYRSDIWKVFLMNRYSHLYQCVIAFFHCQLFCIDTNRSRFLWRGSKIFLSSFHLSFVYH